MAAASKQPPTKNKGAKNDYDDEIFQIGEIDSASWRLRDMSYRLLYHRYGPESDTVAPRQSSSNMNMSGQFDGETCLARLRRDRSGVVRSSFDAAATAILEAVEKSLEQYAKKHRRKSMTFEQDELPPFLASWLKLEEVRLASMERAHNNKEYMKQPLAPGARKVRKPKESSADDSNDKPTLKETASSVAPKFTRNTPASSAAALDSRQQNSRAMLCVAGNVCFDALTPPLPGFDMDVTDIPQNPAKQEGGGSSSTVNMGNVVVEAQAMGQRAIAVAVNGSRRSAQRYQYRKDNLRFDLKRNRKSFFRMRNPFQLQQGNRDDDDESIAFETAIPYMPISDAVTEAWSENCLPRFLSILKNGASHSLYHDIEWWTRHGRIANLFQVMAQEQDNFGTHLIITTEPEVVRFAQEFQPINRHLTLLGMVNAESLRALAYTGDNKKQRRRLRGFFPKATGLVESPYHVLITSYRAFLEDYLHFCQVPFETVVVDDGASWMAAARGDPNSPIGTLWDTAIWSTKDHVGLAGTSYKRWDFTLDEIPLQAQKDAWIGLTARNRILTASVMDVQQRRDSVDVIPVSGLVFFVAPHFATAVREEWDRSRIHTDHASMEHFRKLLARSTIIHHPGEEQDMRTLAMDALNGRLPSPDRARERDPEVPEIIPDEQFVSDGKVAYSRRQSLMWLGYPERSWLRYELGSVSFQPILDALSRSNTYGHFCEEMITASQTTSSGATGQVAGTMAFRLAIRCNRHFGSEQGLRQHLSALHAPPLTWLCRTCGTDCISSQARTHHERSCGQPSAAAGDPKSKDSSSTQKGNRQHFGPVGVVGKKKGQRPGAAVQTMPEDKDPDGSFRIPGYRGVWVNPKGKHFVKVKGKILQTQDGDGTLFFDSIEEAAKGHDNAMKEDGSDPKAELNFQEDGTRIVYEDVTTSSTTGLGGSASNVVPALSVINIKDLPADVKPLLRDPRQTSRTGGNSKRHVYAYRGVCRQARKGHDRWQSQISFMGVNHYLGTFDSEWDAAAIYAWAHLILYGEEATRKAQKEGEEAAAAYEQEKKDIAEGKIVPPPPKPEKKKPKYSKKAKDKKGADGKKAGDEASKKRKCNGDDGAGEAKKKAKPGPKPKQTADKESIAPILAKGASRAYSLAPREQNLIQSDAELIQAAVSRITAAREANYSVAEPGHPAAVDDMLRPCASAASGSSTGAALLLGLSASLFGWDVNAFVSSRVFDSVNQEQDATSALTAEFGEEGFNETFRTMLQGPLCVIGNPSPATRKAHKHLGLGRIPIGSSVGEIDCSIGGTMLSCSEASASIRYAPTTAGEFQMNALTDDDIVTLNGRRITPGMGSFPLFHEDICTVGARVFVFLLPKDR